ncbi:hypothetical protein A4X13_0g9346, partial [Tilletia indica]
HTRNWVPVRMAGYTKTLGFSILPAHPSRVVVTGFQLRTDTTLRSGPQLMPSTLSTPGRTEGSFASRITKLQPVNFEGINGDGTFNLQGLAVLEVPSKPRPSEGDDLVVDASYQPPTLYLYLNNHRPPLDPLSGKPLDPHKVGANSTIEIFKTTLGEKTMEHVRTYADDLIISPNRVAPISPDSFLWTNDHVRKVGFSRALSYIINNGNIGYCDSLGCKIVADQIGFPNGIVASAKPDQFWVPAMREGKLKLFEWKSDNKSLVLLEDIYLDGPPGYPADNLSLNKRTGAILATSVPNAIQSMTRHFPNFDHLAASTIHRITRNVGGEISGKKYDMEKVLEFDGVDFGAYSSAVEDSDRKKMWLFGVGCPLITVCDMP